MKASHHHSFHGTQPLQPTEPHMWDGHIMGVPQPGQVSDPDAGP